MSNPCMFIDTEPVPVWPAFPAKGEENHDPSWQQWLAPLDNVWIPSYIAYGLVDTMAPLYGVMAPMAGKGANETSWPSQKGKDGKGGKLANPDEQEFHQEMLRKLALHLAAQPDGENVTVQGQHHPAPVEKSHVAAKVDESPERVRHFCECANFFMPVDREEDVPTQDTPRSFCATPEDHGMPVWTDPNGPGSQYDDEGSHCVCVPSYIVHGLLEAWEGKGRRSSRCSNSSPNFHDEMLKKLALHLAAQPGEPTAGTHPQMPQVPQVYMSAAQSSAVPHLFTHGPPVQRSPAPPQRVGLFHDHRPQEEFHRQMLQKLALHLAAQPDSPSNDGREAPKSTSSPEQELNRFPHLAAPPVQLEIEPRITYGDPEQVGEDKSHCDRLMADLETSELRCQVVSWVLSYGRSLSLTQFGSRVVQKAIASASDIAERERFAAELLQHSMDLYVSPHGNHVLAKLIEVLPSTRLVCIAEKMRGQATMVARHQFGSRILERLMEHCSEEQIGFLLDELFDETNLEALARHPFANFVVQHIFEHGMPERKGRCFQMLLPYVLQHATHKTASNVVQRMLEHADVSSQALIADAFLAGEGESSLETIAATRYGSFVIHSLVDKLHPRIDAVKARVKAAHPQLSESKFSQKNILDFLGEAFFDD